MSAAFQLDFSGPQTLCDFPGCVLYSFHDGEHQFMSAEEKNERLTAAVTSYGVGTRSYNRSAEKKELDRQRAEATARYEASQHREIEVPVSCTCPQRPYPHELSIHRAIKFESREARWPWSLRWVPEMEG